MTVSRCRSCGAEIVWVLTQKGHRMPIDPEPAPGGDIVVDDGIASVVGGADLVDAVFEGRALYLAHFATCPNAARHRRPRRSAA